MVKNFASMKQFAELIHKLLHSDRDVNLACGGFTGEGKTTFTTALQKEYAKVSGTTWGFDRMTWSRKELLEWVDGKPNSKPGPDGLKEGQVSEYSAILPDELFSMFYRRNWFKEDQIDAIATFNMCRDRHIFLAGNVPVFWDLDGAFQSRIRFYAYIPWRGVAWVFEQENNPFSTDPWNVVENRKAFRKKRNPYSLPNFLFEIHFDDWQPDQKEEYLKIRNSKRVEAISDNKEERIERYTRVKGQRDILIRLVFLLNPKMSLTDMAETIDMSIESIRLIKEGLR